jgi:hypothetical protein
LCGVKETQVITTEQHSETTEVSLDGTFIGAVEEIDGQLIATYGCGVNNLPDGEIKDVASIEEGKAWLAEKFATTPDCWMCGETHGGVYPDAKGGRYRACCWDGPAE